MSVVRSTASRPLGGLMKIKSISVFAALLLSACSNAPDSVYTTAERDAIVARFERYCYTYPPSYALEASNKSIRDCDKIPRFLYQRSNGQTAIGDLQSLNRETGELMVRWSDEVSTPAQSFYPGTSQVLPGKITRVVTTDDYKLWAAYAERFGKQSSINMNR